VKSAHSQTKKREKIERGTKGGKIKKRKRKLGRWEPEGSDSSQGRQSEESLRNNKKIKNSWRREEEEPSRTRDLKTSLGGIDFSKRKATGGEKGGGETGAKKGKIKKER